MMWWLTTRYPTRNKGRPSNAHARDPTHRPQPVPAPLYTLTAVLSLALGIGATTAIFSMLDSPQVRGLVVREVSVIGIGLAAGMGAAAAQLIESVLFETRPADPWVFASAAAVLGVIALAAAYVPVRRATGVDPMIALRYE